MTSTSTGRTEDAARARARWPDAAVAAALAALVFAVFGGCLDHGFVDTWDDALYVTANPAIRGFGPDELRAALLGFHAGNWAPVQMLSYMVDHAAFGLSARAFLRTNLLLHALNGLLVYALASRLSGRRTWPAVAAALFLVHPVQVESVAWVSQRKTLLAATFSLTALHAWLCRARDRDGGRRPAAAALVAFVLALASKSVAVVVPLLLLLLDLCFGRDEPLRTRLRRIVPFAVAAAACAALALASQGPGHAGGLAATFHGGGPGATAATMLTVLARYLALLTWPAGLSAWYSPTVRTGPDAAVAASAALATGLVALGVTLRHRRRDLFFWYATFFAGLLPVSQVVPIVTLMNDRYLYFPMLGAAPFVAAAAFGRSPDASLLRSARGRTVFAAACAAVLALGVAARSRTGAWRDGLTLWTDAVAKVPCGYAFDKLGATYLSIGRPGEAEAACLRAREIEPTYVEALNCVGIARAQRGDLDGASRAFDELLEARPGDEAARRNREKLEVLRHAASPDGARGRTRAPRRTPHALPRRPRRRPVVEPPVSRARA